MVMSLMCIFLLFEMFVDSRAVDSLILLHGAFGCHLVYVLGDYLMHPVRLYQHLSAPDEQSVVCHLHSAAKVALVPRLQARSRQRLRLFCSGDLVQRPESRAHLASERASERVSQSVQKRESGRELGLV